MEPGNPTEKYFHEVHEEMEPLIERGDVLDQQSGEQELFDWVIL